MYVANAETLRSARCCPPCVRVAPLRCPQYGDSIRMGDVPAGWSLRGEPLDLRPHHASPRVVNILYATYLTSDGQTIVVTSVENPELGQMGWITRMHLYTQGTDQRFPPLVQPGAWYRWLAEQGERSVSYPFYTNAAGATGTIVALMSQLEQQPRQSRVVEYNQCLATGSRDIAVFEPPPGPQGGMNVWVQLNADEPTIAYTEATVAGGERFVLKGGESAVIEVDTSAANSSANQMSASADGATAIVIVGSATSPGDATAQVYKLNDGRTAWDQDSHAINVAGADINSGVAMSGDGAVISIGATDTNGAEYITMYRRTTTTTGTSTWEEFGSRITLARPLAVAYLNQNGTIFITGTNTPQPTVQAYRLDASNVWVPAGSALRGSLLDATTNVLSPAVLIATYGLEPTPTPAQENALTSIGCEPAVLAVYTLDGVGST